MVVMVQADRRVGVVEDCDPCPVPFFAHDTDESGYELRFGLHWKPMRAYVRFADNSIEAFEWKDLYINGFGEA
jgi:hypothetical protein